jgi:hypothetical protein
MLLSKCAPAEFCGRKNSDQVQNDITAYLT